MAVEPTLKKSPFSIDLAALVNVPKEDDAVADVLFGIDGIHKRGLFLGITDEKLGKYLQSRVVIIQNYLEKHLKVDGTVRAKMDFLQDAARNGALLLKDVQDHRKLFSSDYDYRLLEGTAETVQNLKGGFSLDMINQRKELQTSACEILCKILKIVYSITVKNSVLSGDNYRAIRGCIKDLEQQQLIEKGFVFQDRKLIMTKFKKLETDIERFNHDRLEYKNDQQNDGKREVLQTSIDLAKAEADRLEGVINALMPEFVPYDQESGDEESD